MEKIEKIIKKFLTKEIIFYAIFGVLTTIVNLGSFYIFTNILKWEENISNIIAITLVVLFGYITNKDLVFYSEAKNIYAGCTHPVLSGPAIERIKNSDIKELVVTNTIPLTEEKKIDKITVLSIAPLFAETIKRINEQRPLGELYEM